MYRRTLGLLVALLLCFPRRYAAGQEWTPPTRQMPMMPSPAQVTAAWTAAQRAWIADPAGADRAVAEGSGARGAAQYVRFVSDMRPVAAWSDRNGDGRCDMVEIYTNGVMVIQVIDSDYNGAANVVRYYDANRRLVREVRS